MEKFNRACIRHRKLVVSIFALFALFSALCMPQVKVNGDFSDYLPPSTPSTIALNTMEDAFDSDVANLRVYVESISLVQAKDLANSYSARDDVEDLDWLGNNLDINIPLQTQDQDVFSSWADSDGYLFSLTIKSTNDQTQIESIRSQALEIEGATSCAIDGTAATNASVMESVQHDLSIIVPLAVLVVLVIMTLTSTSFLYPIIALISIGIAIVMNMGTNIVQGEVSSVTQMVGAVLQLAVSMDYSIVLLSNYGKCLQEFPDAEEGIVNAMNRSFSVVISSAAVTFFGFLSLVCMQFLLGVDMGIVLAKGIVFSFLSITIFMPCLLYMLRKPTQKLSHKPFLPPFSKFAKVCRTITIPACVIAALIALPAFIAQDMTKFNYGSAHNISPSAQVSLDKETINSRFGEEQTWVILVPEGQWGHENNLVKNLQDLPTTNGVTSYGTIAGSSVPSALASKSDISLLLSGEYSRIVLKSNTEAESNATFALVEHVRELCAEEYGDSYHLLGDSVSCYDIKQVASQDMITVRLASLIAIALVLLIMFKSLSIPAILLFCIEISIWINLSIPYFMDASTSYIGFLVIDAVQLGAAVDYSIIFAHEYLRLRKENPEQIPKKRALDAISGAAVPIFTSSTILMLASLGIYLFSSSPMVQDLGLLICRGALIADIIIFLVMPTLFVWRDKLLDKLLKRKGADKKNEKVEFKNSEKLIKKGGSMKVINSMRVGLAKSSACDGLFVQKSLACVLALSLVCVGLPCSWLSAKTIAYADEEQKSSENTSSASASESNGESNGESATATATGTATSAKTSSETPVKTEVIYAKTSMSGGVNGIYVVNGFTGISDCKVLDPGSYEEIENLSTTEELKRENDGISFHVKANEPFYYQGNLSAQTELPWKITLHYFLDDREVLGEDLAGKSGKVKIELSIKPNTQDSNTQDLDAQDSSAQDATTPAQDSSVCSDFSDNYLVQAQASFANDIFNIESSENTTLSHTGSNTSVTCMVIPGESQTISIEGQAENFEFDGFQIAALPLDMAIDLASEDTSELSDETNKLSDALNSASSGASALASGSVSLASGISTLGTGLNTIADKNASLLSGWKSVQNGTSSLASGAAELKSGSETFSNSINEAISEAASGASSLDAAKDAYRIAAIAAQTEIAQTGTVSAQTFASLNDAAQTLALLSGSAGAYQALTQVQSGWSNLASGIDSLESGAQSLNSGVYDFSSGLTSYTSAVSSAASASKSATSGSNELASGAEELSSGIDEITSETSGMDEKIIDALQDKLDELLGANFKTHSFVSPQNENVSAVQFVYVTPEISVEEESEQAQQDTQTSFIDRLAAVFTSIFKG